MQMELAFMQDGGLEDDGGQIDPQSGNEVPSGSLKEEVKDDIPTMLSEGEFVFPADVVRYIGLEKLMVMRQDAKQGLKQMESMGQMGNSDEATMPDDMPFGISDLIVVSVSDSGSITAITGSTGTTAPSGGFEYVRIGNISDTDRQGAVYMTSDDDNAPYIDVIDGVTTHSDFNTSNNIKARLGKLDGISDSDFGDLSEGGNNYGLYSENVYLKGGIRASFGAIGGFGITSTAISASDDSFILSSSNMSMKLGSSANSMTLDSGTGIFMSGSGDFRVGNPSSDQFRFANGDLQITASQINLSGSGVGIATPDFALGTDGLDISSQEKKISLGEGKIILSGSSVPIIKLDGGEISSSNFFVSSVGQMTASAGQIGGFVIDDHSKDGVWRPTNYGEKFYSK